MKAEPTTNITVIRRTPTGSENTSTLALMNARLPSGTREIQIIGTLPHGSAIRPASKEHARALRDWLTETYGLNDSGDANNGVGAVGAAYAAILRSPMNAWRVDQGMNGTLAILRDYIATATGREPEDVQSEYERAAMRAKQ